jgi:hypothetical protein
MRHNARTIRTTFLLGLLAAAWMCGTAHAESVFKCRGSDGLVAFQDHPCARAEVQSEVELEPAPPAAVVVVAEAEQRADRTSRKAAHGQTGYGHTAKAKTDVVSYECRADNGELFYRHGACPKQIRAAATKSGASPRGKAGAQSYAVTAQALDRGEVCRRIARAGSIGRAGHERDETVSTYDRNLGRDPCRRF